MRRLPISSTFLVTVFQPENEYPVKKRHRTKKGKTPVSPRVRRFGSEQEQMANGWQGWQTYRGLAAETTIAVDPNIY